VSVTKISIFLTLGYKDIIPIPSLFIVSSITKTIKSLRYRYIDEINFLDAIGTDLGGEFNPAGSCLNVELVAISLGVAEPGRFCQPTLTKSNYKNLGYRRTVPVLWIRTRKDPILFVGSGYGSGTRGFGSGSG
jgi:hypothetical protein